MDVKKLKAICDENIELMVRKNQDYSGQKGDNITAGGVKGVAIRLLDKVTRLNNLLDSGGDINFESISDTLNDISNYGLIGRLLEEDGWQNPLPDLIYLAGPVDGIARDKALGWRQAVSEMLAEEGISCFNPCAAFSIAKFSPELGISVNAINNNAIMCCNVMLANLSIGGMAFGTISEIERARRLGQRVIVIWPKNKEISLYAYDVEIVHTIDQAIEKILER